MMTPRVQHPRPPLDAQGIASDSEKGQDWTMKLTKEEAERLLELLEVHWEDGEGSHCRDCGRKSWEAHKPDCIVREIEAAVSSAEDETGESR